MKEILPTKATWKANYDSIFNATPRRNRRTIYHIKLLRSKAKLAARIEEERQKT